jgi:hypothetical protein
MRQPIPAAAVNPTRVTVEMTDMSTLRSRLALVPPTDEQLLADGREHARRSLTEAQPPVEDIRNALAMLALATNGTTETAGHLLGFSLRDLESIERLLRAAVVKLDAISAPSLSRLFPTEHAYDLLRDAQDSSASYAHAAATNHELRWNGTSHDYVVLSEEREVEIRAKLKAACAAETRVANYIAALETGAHGAFDLLVREARWMRDSGRVRGAREAAARAREIFQAIKADDERLRLAGVR